MQPSYWAIIAIVIIVGGLGVFLSHRQTPSSTHTSNTNIATDQNTNTDANANEPVPTNTNSTTNTPLPESKVTVPITGFFDRITKKPFGIYITKQSSPVQPERFTGYHAGADAEATTEEANIDVPVFSIADGTVVAVRDVDGYGGVMLIRYVIEGETVTAVYGHIRLKSATVKVGDTTTKGQKIAVLGTGYSAETDGERKHLHFALIKGRTITYRGYVQSQSELSTWYDPVAWLHQRGL